MNEKVIAKVVIAAAGLAVFFAGVRTGLDWVRWIGIALVAVAFLMRFSTRR